MSGKIRKLAFGVASSLTAVLMVFTGATTAHADPITVDEAKAQYDQLEQAASDLGTQLNASQTKVDASSAHLDSIAKDIVTQQTKVDGLRGQAAAVALQEFQNRSVDTTVQLFTASDPDTLMQRMSTVSKVDENMNTMLQDFQDAQANLDDLKRTAEAEKQSLVDEQGKIADLAKQAKDKADAAEALWKKLTAEQQRQMAAAQAAQAGTTATSTTTTTTASAGGGGSSRAQGAVAAALSKVGSAYVYGAAGPSVFDCSGLMMWAYAQVGVSLPHYSGAQFAMGVPVAQSDLQPGDLVFFYPSISHVGMYIGNGMMVHASNPRTGVLVAPLAYNPSYQGARRLV